MKRTLISIILALMILLCSCNQKISTNITKTYEPIHYTQKVIVLGIEKDILEGSEELGLVKIGDKGFTTKCKYEYIIEKAKYEARKIGGNGIKIIKYKPPTASNIGFSSLRS